MKPSKIILINISILFLFLVLYFLTANLDLFSFKKKESRVVLIMKTTERISDFWLILEKGAIQAGEDLGIVVEVTGPDQEDNIQQQISIMESVISTKPDAIVLAATDYFRLVPVAGEAKKAGIPLVTVDSFIDSDHALCEIGTANNAAGGKLAAHMASKLEKGDTIAIVSFVPDSSPAIEREQGFRNVMGNQFHILETVYTNNSIDLGRIETKRLLEEHPEIKGIAALNENSAVGVYRGLLEIQPRKDLLFMTFDSDRELIRGLEEGIINATLVQKPYNMGYLAVQNAYKISQSKLVPPSIDTGAELITLDNMYDIKNQKLLFPLQ